VMGAGSRETIGRECVKFAVFCSRLLDGIRAPESWVAVVAQLCQEVLVGVSLQ